MISSLEEAFTEAAKLPEREQARLARWILDTLASEQRWDEAFTKSPDALEQLADEALAEYHSGETDVLDPDTL